MSDKKEKKSSSSKKEAGDKAPDAGKLYPVLKAMEITVDGGEEKFLALMAKHPDRLAALHKEISQLQATFKKTSPMRNMFKYDVRRQQVSRLYSTTHPNIRIPETSFTRDLTDQAVLHALAKSEKQRALSDAALLYQLFEDGTVPRRQDLLAPCKVEQVFYADEGTQECHALTSPRGKKLLGAYVLVKAIDNRKYAATASQECEALWKKREAALAILRGGHADANADDDAPAPKKASKKNGGGGDKKKTVLDDDDDADGKRKKKSSSKDKKVVTAPAKKASKKSKKVSISSSTSTTSSSSSSSSAEEVETSAESFSTSSEEEKMVIEKPAKPQKEEKNLKKKKKKAKKSLDDESPPPGGRTAKSTKRKHADADDKPKATEKKVKFSEPPKPAEQAPPAKKQPAAEAVKPATKQPATEVTAQMRIELANLTDWYDEELRKRNMATTHS